MFFVGSVVALFQVAPVATSISQAVTTLLTNRLAVLDLNVTSVNINGRSYSPSSTASSSSENNTVWTNVGLIAGLVVGLVGALILIVAVILAKRAHSTIARRHRLIVEPNDPSIFDGINPSDPPLPREDPPTTSETIVELFISPPPTPLSPRVRSAFSYNRSRTPSVDISAHLSDHDDLDDRQPPPRKILPVFKLLDFE